LKYSYVPTNTCASQIRFDLEGDVVKNVEFTGGCNGNLKAIPILLEGFTVEQIEEKCKGIQCGRRPTSCVDQLALAVREAYNNEQLSPQ
jgi:uncharacterized protein (TIGR03905 family)